MEKNWLRSVFSFPTVALLIACAGQTLPVPPAPVPALAPAVSSPRAEPAPNPAPVADWPTATPEEEGLDSKDLADLLESIRTQGDPIDSVLIVRDGRLVLDACFYPFRSGLRHELDTDDRAILH